MFNKPYDSNLEFNSEGYISQLVNSIGGKKINSISPDTFSYRIVKTAGNVPVVQSNYNPNNALFYGNVFVSTKLNTSLADTFIVLKNNIMVTVPNGIGFSCIPNLLFTSLLQYHNLALNDASEYNQVISFVGYKVNLQ